MNGVQESGYFLVHNLIMSNGTVIAGSDKEKLSSPEVTECLDFIYNMYNVDHVAWYLAIDFWSVLRQRQ